MHSNQDLWEKVYKKRDEIVSREIAGETILVPIKGKLADMQRIFALDHVSEYIWEQLDGETKVKDILTGVVDLYDVDKQQAQSDLFEFINELLDAELIVGVEQ